MRGRDACGARDPFKFLKTIIAPLHLWLAGQFLDELLEDMHMMVDIVLRMLDGDRPLIVKARREEGAAISKEEPVGIRDIHVDILPGTVMTRPPLTGHGP